MADPIANLKADAKLAGSTSGLAVAIIDGTGAQVTSFGGSGGTADADGSTHTAGASLGTPLQGVFESVPTTIADGKLGTVGITNDRKLKVSGSFSASPITSATTALTNVAASAASVTILASNAARLNFTIENDSDSNVYLKCGATASATSFTKKLLGHGSWSTGDLGVNYTGKIDAIWDSATGNARVTEFTA